MSNRKLIFCEKEKKTGLQIFIRPTYIFKNLEKYILLSVTYSFQFYFKI